MIEKTQKTVLSFCKKKIDEDQFVYPVSSLPYSKEKVRRLILKFAPEFIKSSNVDCVSCNCDCVSAPGDGDDDG